MSEEINNDRRRFLRNSAMTIAAAELVTVSSAFAQSSKKKPSDVPPINPGTKTSFGSLKQIDAGLLNVGYAEAGPPMVLRSFFCTAGLTTFTASSTLRRCWRRRATG